MDFDLVVPFPGDSRIFVVLRGALCFRPSTLNQSARPNGVFYFDEGPRATTKLISKAMHRISTCLQHELHFSIKALYGFNGFLCDMCLLTERKFGDPNKRFTASRLGKRQAGQLNQLLIEGLP